MTKFLKQFFVNISQKALFVTQKSQKSQNIFSLLGCNFNNSPAEIAEMAEMGLRPVPCDSNLII